MIYRIYKLQFTTPIHFGKNDLSSSDYTLCSDTIFSALCSEAASEGNAAVERLVSLVKNGYLQISDAFPYCSDCLYLPKPYMHIEHDNSSESSVVRKAYKKLKYIPVEKFENYMSGTFDVMDSSNNSSFGMPTLKMSASIRNDKEEAEPYEIGLFSFGSDCGLYIIFGIKDEVTESIIDELMDRLSFSGIGGRRSSGFGRFTFVKSDVPEWLIERLTSNGSDGMLINTALPKDSELNDSLERSTYGLIKRSGFVTSVSYSSSWQRKRDIYMFKSGSCFEKRFEGDVYDVSVGGAHPVYRCGKPMFMRIKP